MFFEPYNPLFLNIIKRAKFEAKFKLKSNIIQPEHILLAFLKSSKYSTYKILHHYNLFYKSTLRLFKYNYQNFKNLKKNTKNYIFSLSTVEIFQNVEKLRKLFQNTLLTPEILLYSTLNSNPNTHLFAILNKNKYDSTGLKCKLLNRLIKSLKKFLTPTISKNLNKGYKRKFLNFYGFVRYKTDYLIDLYYNKAYITTLTENNNDIYTIGQHEILKKSVNILTLNSENHIIIHGKPGVGKTTFIYNLIKYIEENETPINIIIKEFISINLVELLHNTSEEENFSNILKDVFKLTCILRNKVLVLDNLHLIFTPKEINSIQIKSINALRPFFTQKNLFNFIGLLDSIHYNEFIKSDSIFSKYAKILELLPLNFNETLMIVNNLRTFYEMYYGIQITDNAILSILDNSNQLTSNYEMPKKALIFLDEACSYLKYVTCCEDKDFKHLLFKLTFPQAKYLYTNALKTKQYKLANLFLKYEECLYLFLEIFIQFLHHIFKSNIYFLQNNIILATFLTKIISTRVLNLTSSETSKALSYYIDAKGPTLLTNEELISLELDIQKQIVGQSNAIKYLVDAVRRDALKLRDRNRPIGTFLFIGPTGVGKTEMAKVLTKIVYKNDLALLRFDMSEYSEEHSISKLIGTTAGYVGFDEGGHLTNVVKKNPFSILLFDEIEKSHSSIYNLLLQVLDEGRLTTGQGETVSFTNTLIILTSNLAGTELLSRQLQFNNYIKSCKKLKKQIKTSNHYSQSRENQTGKNPDKTSVNIDIEEDITNVNSTIIEQNIDLDKSSFEKNNNNKNVNENKIDNKEKTPHNINNNQIVDAEIINNNNNNQEIIPNAQSDSERINKNYTNNESEIEMINRIRRENLIKTYNLENEETEDNEESTDIKNFIEMLVENNLIKTRIPNLGVKSEKNLSRNPELNRHINKFLTKIVKKALINEEPLINNESGSHEKDNNLNNEKIKHVSQTSENNFYFEDETNINFNDEFIDNFLKNIETNIKNKNFEQDIFESIENEKEFEKQIIKIQQERSALELEEDIRLEKEILDEKLIEHKLSEKLPAEFINRLDAIIIFDAFTESEAFEISILLVENFCKRMYELKKYKITYNLKVIQKIVKKGYDIQLGARPLKRALNEIIEIPFADFLMNNELPDYSYIHINLNENDEINFLTN
jgi:ATP-dependent Clp protease ATP-binding subunit ClpA